jgi:hypothetical protein
MNGFFIFKTTKWIFIRLFETRITLNHYKMKSIIACICVCVFYLPVSARQKIERSVTGSWKIVRADSNGYSISNRKPVRYFSFLRSGNFQLTEEAIINDSTGFVSGRNFYYGKWKTSQENNSIFIIDYYTNGVLSYDQEYKIKSLTDSVLVLDYAVQQTQYTLYLTKVAPLKENKFTRVKKKDFRHEETRYVLVNSADTTKRVYLNASDGISVTIEEPSSDSTIASIQSWTSGPIENIKDSALSLSVYHYSTTIHYKNDSSKTISKVYKNEGGYTTTINLHYINSISYFSSRRMAWNTYFGVAAMLGGMDVLFFAPVASIKRNWEFDSKRYFRLAGIGLAGMAICIPLSACFFEKSYSITQKNSRKDKNYWYFQN